MDITSKLENLNLNESEINEHRLKLINGIYKSISSTEGYLQLRKRYESTILSPFIPNELKIEILNFLLKCDVGLPCQIIFMESAKIDSKILKALRTNIIVDC